MDWLCRNLAACAMDAGQMSLQWMTKDSSGAGCESSAGEEGNDLQLQYETKQNGRRRIEMTDDRRRCGR
ncbi:hypothetical protein GOP47_0008761 [Adiantum capillus-veneris]|uniref:Uncharacterized protein n=1 Tax=Adiantum capillus-veneris TaxID=13818 RepID=A0A9D4UYZ3_ADICA|nr:hypothetical protein GOP47_0008761 [Adiantum capillus-veneris]